MDLSIAISITALSVSALGPVITAVAHNIHERLMYKTRYYTEHSQEVIETYLKSVGRYAFTSKWEDRQKFGEASAEIFMYAPKELWDDIKKINVLMIELSDFSNTFEDKQQKTNELQNAFFQLSYKASNLKRKEK